MDTVHPVHSVHTVRTVHAHILYILLWEHSERLPWGESQPKERLPLAGPVPKLFKLLKTSLWRCLGRLVFWPWGESMPKMLPPLAGPGPRRSEERWPWGRSLSKRRPPLAGPVPKLFMLLNTSLWRCLGRLAKMIGSACTHCTSCNTLYVLYIQYTQYISYIRSQRRNALL